MLIDESKNPFVGKRICGVRVEALDDEKGYAVYAKNGRSCGVTFGQSDTDVVLYYYPSVQLPPFARDKHTWSARMWALDDDRAMDVDMDTWDGEITYLQFLKDSDADIQAAVEATTDFLLGYEFHEATVAVVRDAIQ